MEKMISSFSLLYLFILISIAKITDGYTYRGEVSTDDGYCDLEVYGFEKIKIGESSYNDTKCEKATCEESLFEVVGCGDVATDRENCYIVRRPGRYPDCCETIECDDDEQQNYVDDEEDNSLAD